MDTLFTDHLDQVLALDSEQGAGWVRAPTRAQREASVEGLRRSAPDPGGQRTRITRSSR